MALAEESSVSGESNPKHLLCCLIKYFGGEIAGNARSKLKNKQVRKLLCINKDRQLKK
jgi:hypothetical protein